MQEGVVPLLRSYAGRPWWDNAVMTSLHYINSQHYSACGPVFVVLLLLLLLLHWQCYTAATRISGKWQCVCQGILVIEADLVF